MAKSLETQQTLIGESPIEAWYNTHKEQYDTVEARLAAVNEKFENADLETQTTMLRLSYTFAVMSIQTRVQEHEQGFRAHVAGAPVYEALKYTNFGGKKGKGAWVKETLSDESHFTDVISLLMDGEIDKAHRYMVDEWTGVAATKGAFVLAMLGYTQKMCLDVNVRRLLGLDYGDTVVISKYDSWCQEIVDQYNDEVNVDPFVLQWILFDYQRGDHSPHDIYFEALGVK